MATPSPKTCLTACLLLLLTVASLVASAPFPDHLDSPGRSHGLHVERHGKQDDAQSHDKQDDAQSHDKQDDAQSHDKQDDAQSHDKQDDAQSHDKQDDAQSHDKQDDTQSDDAQIYDAQSHDAQIHDAQSHDAQIHDAQSHDAQSHDAQSHDAQSHDAQSHDAQSHDAQIHDAQSHDAQIHDKQDNARSHDKQENAQSHDKQDNAQNHDKQDEASSIHLPDNYNLDEDKPGHHNSDGEAQVNQTAEGARSPTSTTTTLATGDSGQDGGLRRSTKPEKVTNNDMEQVYVTDDPIENDQGFENGNVRSVNDTPHDDIGVQEQDSGDNDFEINSTQDPSAASAISPAPIDQRFFFSEYDDYSYESYDYFPECNCGCGSDCVIYDSTYLRDGQGPA
ncbi:protein starmaker-like [Procambarus clarkii]|uniref:protein starmaker-like n=1 Tax=Procambarus clarkii TaxID=6728 RepID=UPI0037425A36